MNYTTEPEIFKGASPGRITEEVYQGIKRDIEKEEKELDHIRCKRGVMPKFDIGMLQRAPKESFIDVPVRLCADDDEDLMGFDAVFVLRYGKKIGGENE